MFAPELEEKVRAKVPGIFPWLRAQGELGKNIPLTARTIRETTTLSTDDAIDYGKDAVMVHLWQQSGRVIYSVDQDFTKEMLEMAWDVNESADLPMALLENLPYDCFSAEFSPFRCTVKDKQTGQNSELYYTGRCLVTILNEEELGFPFRAIYSIWDTGDPKEPTTSFFFPLTGNTYKECMENLRQTCQSQIHERELTLYDMQIEMIPSLLLCQLILYLQSDNADLQSRPGKSTSSKGKRKGASKLAKPPKVIDVGYHVGRVLRRYAAQQAEQKEAREEEKKEPGAPRAKTRPHTRRAHWHHFWTGPRSDPDQRKKILRWVHPIFVNPQLPKDDKPTVMKLQKPKEKK